jgi:hypothetical protein
VNSSMKRNFAATQMASPKKACRNHQINASTRVSVAILKDCHNASVSNTPCLCHIAAAGRAGGEAVEGVLSSVVMTEFL